MKAWKPSTVKAVDPEVVRRGLGESIFGRNVLVYDSLDSTNAVARELGSKGAPEGTLVLAEEQTAGRGRMGRRWWSPKYGNLLFSVLLRPALTANRVFALTMAFALAGAEAVEFVSGVIPCIKWPNDLFVSNRKLGGVLTELSTCAGSVEQMVLGMGLNVNWNPAAEKCGRYAATSVRLESDRWVSREELLVEIVERLEVYYGAIVSGDVVAIKRRWDDRSMLLGKWVTVDTGQEMIRGRALEIDDIGALILECGSGETRQILNGDVSLEEIEDEGVGDG
jgi:BirA family biotin operon repressor/biotin-[acetyl-CoA-carboxylase] ligase